MTTERRPGSDRGKASIDWNQAFLTYASLPPDRRDYQSVADTYNVSVRTVERHGRTGGWKNKALELDRQATIAAAEQLRDARAEQLVDYDKLARASLLTYANDLRAGKVRVAAVDLARLYKLQLEVWQELDRPDPTDQPPTSSNARARVDPHEHRRQVLRALHEAGAIDNLLALPADDSAPSEQTNERAAETPASADEEAA